MFNSTKTCRTCGRTVYRSKATRLPHAGHLIKGYYRFHPLVGAIAAAAAGLTAIGLFDKFYCGTCQKNI